MYICTYVSCESGCKIYVPCIVGEDENSRHYIILSNDHISQDGGRGVEHIWSGVLHCSGQGPSIPHTAYGLQGTHTYIHTCMDPIHCT